MSPSAFVDGVNNCTAILLKIRKSKFLRLLPQEGKYLILGKARNHYDFIDFDEKLLVLTAEPSRCMQLASPEAAEYLRSYHLVNGSGREGYRLNRLNFR